MNKKWVSLPPIKQFPSRKEWEKHCWEKISKSSEALEILTTTNERHNLVMRSAIIQLMNSGKKTKEIIEELQISPQTISSIKKALKENKYRSYRERGKTERRKRTWSRDSFKKRNIYRPHWRTKYGKVPLP